MKIAIVVAKFNQQITESLLRGAVERLVELGVLLTELETIWVPGAVELPLAAQQYARRGDLDAVICLGAVIRGGTDHYQFVCDQVSYGCQRVALDYNLPIIFGVLTTQNIELALERAGGSEGNKGREAADAAWDMIHVMKKINLIKEEPCLEA